VRRLLLTIAVWIALLSSARATTKGLSQIVTPDLQGPGDLSLSFQAQSERIANPYELQAEMGLTSWGEFAVFRGFKPDEWIFGTEFGLLTKEPYLLSVGFVNWSPHLDVDPQPYIEAGYAIHASYKNEAILGYAYDFNQTWRVQVDFQSGAETHPRSALPATSPVTCKMNPALYINNGPRHDLFGYIVFTYTFHLWNKTGGNELEKSEK
jgi:hypothetical protein